jgi:hypothetical protein
MPCYDLNIYLTTAYQSDIKVAELSIGKYPNTVPTFDNLEWTSYNWGDQNLTINAFDPNFDGGYVCGADGKSLCEMYVGVYGYCVDDYDNPIDFEITASLIRNHKIFNVPQRNQYVAPMTHNFYEFCVASEADATAQLLTFTDACSCPYNYSDLEMVISKTNRQATSQDLVWRVEHTDVGYKEIDLMVSDIDTRPGTYYLNVYGYCNQATSCVDACTCAPCTNLASSPYALLVNYSDPKQETYPAHRDAYLGSSCISGGSSDVCSSTCTSDASSSSSSDDKHSSETVAIIVVLVVFFFIAIVAGSIYYLVHVKAAKGAGQSKYDATSADDVMATTAAVDESDTKENKVLEVERIYKGASSSHGSSV